MSSWTIKSSATPQAESSPLSGNTKTQERISSSTVPPPTQGATATKPSEINHHHHQQRHLAPFSLPLLSSSQRRTSSSSLLEAVVGSSVPPSPPPPKAYNQPRAEILPIRHAHAHARIPSLENITNTRASSSSEGWVSRSSETSCSWDVLSDVSSAKLNEGGVVGLGDKAIVEELEKKVQKRKSQLPQLESQLKDLEQKIREAEERLAQAQVGKEGGGRTRA